MNKWKGDRESSGKTKGLYDNAVSRAIFRVI